MIGKLRRLLIPAMLLALSMAVMTAVAVAFTPTNDDNMNGDYLPLQNTPGHDASNWSRTFKDYPGGVESFDVYSPPITTLYSQV